MNKGRLAANYCLTRFNAEHYADKQVYYNQFERVLREIEKESNGLKSPSYQELCDRLDPKVSIRSGPLSLGRNPLKQDRKEIETLERLLELGISDIIDLEKAVSRKTVFIKPNLNFVPDGINSYGMTDPRLLLALINLLYKNGARVLVGEKPGQKRKSRDSYELLREHFDVPTHVDFIELGSERRRDVETATHLVSQTLALPESYFLADFVIVVSKMKTHTLTGVSLGIKNLFGLLTDEEKMRHHNEDINPKLVDMLSVRHPDLTIIDCIYSVEGQGPLYGTPRYTNLLLAGNNCVSVDAVSTYLMGFCPKEIAHIALAYECGLGDINLRNVRFPAREPYSIRSHFRRGDSLSNPIKQIELVTGKNIPSGYLNALSHSLERLSYEGKNPEKVKIYVGEFQGMDVEEDAILFGDITANSVNRHPSRIISGHPPTAFELYNLLK